MKYKSIILILMALVSNQILAQNKIEIIENSSLKIGERVEIRSKILNEIRTLNIYLPNEYSNDSIKKYPVIYLLDGSIDEDFIHISGLVQFGSFSWINMIPKTIVAGISNVDRKERFYISYSCKKR